MLSKGLLEKMVELRRRVEMSAWDQVALKPKEFVEMVDELELNHLWTTGQVSQVEMERRRMLELVSEQLKILGFTDAARVEFTAKVLQMRENSAVAARSLMDKLPANKPRFEFSGWRGPDSAVFDLVRAELEKASKHHGGLFASLHEAYAVLLEEVDEVWEITKQKESARDLEHLRHELIQVAAMAVKAIHSIEGWKRG